MTIITTNNNNDNNKLYNLNDNYNSYNNSNESIISDTCTSSVNSIIINDTVDDNLKNEIYQMESQLNTINNEFTNNQLELSIVDVLKSNLKSQYINKHYIADSTGGTNDFNQSIDDKNISNSRSIINSKSNINTTKGNHADSSPPDVTSSVPLASTVGLADSSSNYLPVNGKATPGDRGEESETIYGSRGELNREADGRKDLKWRATTASGKEGEGRVKDVTSGGGDCQERSSCVGFDRCVKSGKNSSGDKYIKYLKDGKMNSYGYIKLNLEIEYSI